MVFELYPRTPLMLEIIKNPRQDSKSHESVNHNMPESFKAFCRIVSFTAAKTSLMFVVSVACVKLDTVSLRQKVFS